MTSLQARRQLWTIAGYLRPMGRLRRPPARPELGALVLLNPEAEDLFHPVRPHAEGDVHRLVPDQTFVPHLDAQRVEENQRIDRLQRTILPGRHLIQDSVRDRADQVRRSVDPIELAQMSLDLARA